MGRELFFARLSASHVLGEKLHLLPDAPANDDVVAVEARGAALAVEYLVADVVFDEAVQLLLRRRTPPGARESVGKIGDALRRNDDLRGLRLLLADETVETEQRRSDHQEMQQRFPQKRAHQGVYQIGEV